MPDKQKFQFNIGGTVHNKTEGDNQHVEISVKTDGNKTSSTTTTTQQDGTKTTTTVEKEKSQQSE